MTTLGAFDIEAVGLDIADPDNRILSIAIYGDLYPDGIVLMFDNEQETIESFLHKAAKHDALLGWNSDTFDVPFLKARLRQHGIEFDYIDGMPIFLDCMRVHKHMLRKQETSNSLDHVSRKHLQDHKLPFNPNRTEEFFAKYKEELAAYNVQDARLVWNLNKQFGYWDTFNGIVERAQLTPSDARKFAGISQKEDGGFAWWRPLMGVVRQFCAREGRTAPEWPTDDEKRLRGMSMVERPGGFVEEPLAGHHRNVIEFDFKSLYPTLIQSFNLGYDSEDPEGEIAPPNGRFRRSPRSTIAAILDELVIERTAVKKAHEDRKEAGASAEELAELKGRAEALKVFNNSYYGQFYAPFSPLYHYNSARNITKLGQECVKTMLNKMREMGLTVIAGDTDSTYVSVPPEMFNKETALRLAKELTAHIAAHLKETYNVEFVGSFDFKALIDHMAAYKKKFYARLEMGKPISEMELRGYVRGTTPELQRVAQKAVFETMFSGGDVRAILATARDTFLRQRDHTLLFHWMQVKSMRRSTAQARAKVLLQHHDVVLSKFDQVGFLIIGKGTKKSPQRRIAAHYLPDSTIEWMWEDEQVLRQDTAFLTDEEAAKAWDEMMSKLDGVET